MGEAVKACIALKPGQTADPDELKQFCAACLADYKVPKFIEFLESLPRNPAGKVIKKELRTLPEKEPLSRPFR
jgi:acyl-CoA synthetase (AMP-forming)/AMP-acid ligase II